MFYGETVKKLTINDFLLTETAYPAKTAIPRHSHGEAYFCYVIKGDFAEDYENKTRVCQPAMAIFHPSGETHADRFGSGPGKCFNFQMSDAWIDRVRRSSFNFDAPVDFRGGAAAIVFNKLYREFHNFDEVSPLAIESLALELSVIAARSERDKLKGASPHWLSTVRDLLHDRFAENLSLNFIAGSADVHPVHLARTFRLYYGSSIGEYVRKLRIDYSCRALGTTDVPISRIAYEAGFSSQSHFSTLFKRYIGSTPAEYRSAYRKC